jgi:hypothetical protein
MAEHLSHPFMVVEGSGNSIFIKIRLMDSPNQTEFEVYSDMLEG